MISNRYDRQICLPEFGQEGQLRLSRASVVIVGAGGMGSAVIQYLAAAGIGRLGIIDSDVVEESNLQRQVIYGIQSLGINKANAAGDYIKNLNPDVKAELYPIHLTEANALKILNQYDYVIDCSDNFDTRYLISDFCSTLNKPWIYGAIHRYEGQVSVLNYHGSPSYRELFPQKSMEEIPDCARTGVLGVLPGILGVLQATECLKLITGIGQILAGELLVFNLLTQEYTRYSLNKIRSESTSCKIGFLHPKELKKNREQYVLVDVREYDEAPISEDSSIYRIPLSGLLKRYHEIPQEKDIALICQAGFRSQQGAKLLAQIDAFHNIYSVQGGMIEYERIC